MLQQAIQLVLSTLRTPPDAHNVTSHGQSAIAAAKWFWEQDIYDPPKALKSPKANASREHIDNMLRLCGWTWEIPYLGDGQVEWCGLFAGACWVKAGLKPEHAKTFFPSTYRLSVWAHYRAYDARNKNPRPKVGPWREVADLDETSTELPFEPQAGDILVVGNKGVGQHIALVESWDPVKKVFRTIEGNGVGLGPDGKQRQGVVRAERRLGGSGYCARRLIRPAPSDLR